MGKVKYQPGMAVVFDSEEEADKFINLVDPNHEKAGVHFVHNYMPQNYFRESTEYTDGKTRLCYGHESWDIDKFKFSDLEFEEKIEYTVEELWTYIYKLAAPSEKGGMTFKMMQEAYMPEEHDVCTNEVLTNLTPDEFVKKSREYYKRKKAIKPGTVVKSTISGLTGIVVSNDGVFVEVFAKSKPYGYVVRWWNLSNIEVTDRYISGFAAFIESMNKEEEIWKTEIDG